MMHISIFISNAYILWGGSGRVLFNGVTFYWNDLFELKDVGDVLFNIDFIIFVICGCGIVQAIYCCFEIKEFLVAIYHWDPGGPPVFKGGYDAHTRKQVKMLGFSNSRCTRVHWKGCQKQQNLGKKGMFFNPWNCDTCLGYNTYSRDHNRKGYT